MNKWHLRFLRLAYLGLAAILPVYALADYNATQGAGTIFRAFDATHGGTSLCAAANTQCQGIVNTNSAGAEVGIAAAPLRIDPTGTTTQPVSGTVAATQSGAWTVNPTTAANWGLGTFGAAFPAAGAAVGMTQGGNLVAITGTSGNLNVQCANCSGSGVSTADQATFTQGTSLFAGVGGVFNDTATVSSGFQGMFRMTTKRAQIMDIDTTGSALFSALTAPAKIDQTTPGTTNGVVVNNANSNGRTTAANSSPVVPVAAASTAGAIAPNNTTAVVVKASAGTLFGVQVYGIGAAPAYLKIYNATSATCGSGTPVKRLMIPAAATAANGAGSNVTFGPGLAFATGITYCVTTGITDADTTAAAANTFLVNVDYE